MENPIINTIRPLLIGCILLVILSTEAKSQQYVGLDEKEVLVKLKKETRSFQQEQRTIEARPNTPLRFSGSRAKDVTIEVLCDSAGICYAEKYICSTESSALQWQKKILVVKELGWQKINENQHVSSQDRQRLLEMYKQDLFWVVQVLRTNWSPLQYQMLFSDQ